MKKEINKKEIARAKEIKRRKLYQKETKNIQSEFYRIQKREKEYDEKESGNEEYDYFAFVSLALSSTFGFAISFLIQKILFLISIDGYVSPIILSGFILLILFIFYSKEGKYQTPTIKLKTIMLLPMITLWSTLLMFEVELGLHLTLGLTVYPLFLAIIALKNCLTKKENMKTKIFTELYTEIENRAVKHDPEYVRQYKLSTNKLSLLRGIKTILRMKH